MLAHYMVIKQEWTYNKKCTTLPFIPQNTILLFNLSTPLDGRQDYPHFTDKEAKVQVKIKSKFYDRSI